MESRVRHAPFNDMYTAVIVYLNDMCIFTKNKTNKEHSEVIKEVLHRLRENDLYTKPEKCVFNADKVDFLGMTVSADGVGMQNNKVDAILDWPATMKLKQLQSFLSLCNYYHCFINSFGQIACPLNDLTKKNVPYTWGEAQQNAFDMLKKQFTTAPLLTFPDASKEMCIETDASDIATGAV